ncbi:MAG: UbiA family prenyltransferase [Candidatus Bathyarchaeia archaeon]
MDRIADYARLGRMHTAPSEMFGLPLAAYLGGVPPVYLIFFVVLGLMVHTAGFGMNSLVDYLYGYDRADPSKAHHPLVTGRISVLQASVFIFGLQLASVFYFIALTHVWFAVVSFAVYVFFGWCYNLLAKRNKWAAMAYLGISMGALFFAAASVKGLVTSTIVAASLYTCFVVVFQIGICGDLKDLAAGTHEVNVLQQLGTHVEGGMMVTSQAGYLLAFVLSAFKTAFIGYFAYTIDPLWAVPVTIISGMFFFFFSYREMEGNRPYDHAYRLRLIGFGEVMAYIFLIVAAFPLMLTWAPYAFILFFVAPVLFYFFMNRMIWPESGSGWAPGV